LTDGMWVLKPGQIEAELTPTASGTSLDHPKLLIVSRDQLSPNQQARLIPLGPAND